MSQFSFNNPASFYIPPVVGPAIIGSHIFTVAGTYNYDCSIGSHASFGMIGTIIVEPIPADEEDPEEVPDEGNEGLQTQSEGFEVPHVELVVVIGILLLIYQVIRIRSFGGIKLQKVNGTDEEMEAEILE